MSASRQPAAIRILAGPSARALIASQGLRTSDIGAIAGAAGGPKGLALLSLDRWLFGDWLKHEQRELLLAGASIGAWRMAAASQRDAPSALDRLEAGYLELQRYPERPSSTEVSQTCRAIVSALINGSERDFCADMLGNRRLLVITARSRRYSSMRETKIALARAAIANLAGRRHLARHLERVGFCSAHQGQPLNALLSDAFGAHLADLNADNLEDALLASGSIPLIADPVQSPQGAPEGSYWDGGLIDYHLYWPWHSTQDIVLYPHFTDRVTAGWLDKFLPWRRHGIGSVGAHWLDNVLMIVPSAALLARLPNAKLPDRSDFYRYGTDHDARLRDWRRAIAECGRMADEFAEFARNPDLSQIEAL